MRTAVCFSLLLASIAMVAPSLLFPFVSAHGDGAAHSAALDLSANALPEDVIAAINADASVLWNASINPFFYERDLAFVRSLCGVRLRQGRPAGGEEQATASLPVAAVEERRYGDDNATVIPALFDSRQHWGAQCQSLLSVRNQGQCGSCWAFGAVEAMTDRICIASSGAQRPVLSASDPLSCCADCGSGCDGGTLAETWAYYVSTGIVTGGAHGDTETCLPYQFAACSHHLSDPANNCSEPAGQAVAAACPNACSSASYPTSFSADKHFGSVAYHLPTARDMQLDLLRHGPIEVAFSVYSDFPSYRSGIYHKTVSDDEEALGGHAVKLIGWGSEQGVDYWLCVNRWGQARLTGRLLR